jgi:hypothetical protein
MPRTIVVGDVHGCLDELEALLGACAITRGDRLVLAGDLVAKGPDSQGVVQLARETGATAVLGNHDAHVLRARDVARGTLLEPAKAVRSTHAEVVATLKARDWAYLEGLPLFVRLGSEVAGDADTVVLHGGAVPGIAIEDQTRDNLINMRSIDDDGQPSKRITGRPWAAVWAGPERIVFGHDAVRGLQQHPFATGLDTGCVYGGRLTALLLPERRLISIPARRAYVDARGD